MATKTSSQDLANLVINRVESPTAFQQMVAAGQVNANELYLVEGDETVTYSISKSGGTITLTGSDGSTSTVTVPTATSDLTNDSGYITSSAVPSASTSTPAMDGTGAAGSSSAYARGDHVHPTDTSRAPTSHASTATTYGAGTSSNYGHLKLSASTTSTLGTSGGTAATPSAVKAVKDAIPTTTSELTNDSGFITDAGVTSFNGDTGAITYTAPVASVNGSTGDVTISVPTATSDLTNDSGFITSASVPSASTTTPSMDGTASYGSGTTWARADHVHPTDTSRAPTSHASTATTYGIGTSSNYGHVKLSDSTSSTSSTSSGVAATPAAVKAAYDLANGKQDPLAEIRQTWYGTCGTTASTQAKTVSITGITALTAGLAISVKFTYAQTYNGQPTLNVSSLGAKNIVRMGTTAAARYEWQAGEVIDFVYDGTSWVMVNGATATTTYYGMTVLSSSTTSTSEVMAATPAAVKAVKDAIPTATSDLTNDSGFITDAGVTSFNGSTGAITYTAPVTSVNGDTGDVTVNVPTATSDLTNDSGFITSADVPTATSELTNDSGFITSAGAPVQSVNSKTGVVSLTYSDVSAAPTSHAATTTTYGAATSSNYGHVRLSDSTSSTSSTSGGYAATPAAVKAAYDLANSKTDNTGTITGVSANGTSVATSGVANIPSATTSRYGVTQLSSSTSSTSTTLAATASAVKAAYDLANGKQNALTFDSTPTNGSTNPVTSGGVYTALQNAEKRYSMVFTTSTWSNLAITLPASTHGCGTEPMVQVQRLNGTNYESYYGYPSDGWTVSTDTSGNITISVSSSGMEFSGRLLVR